MRKLLFLLLVLVVGGVGLGFYLGWFSVSTSRDPATGRTGVQLTIDQEKMKTDTQAARQKVAGAVNQTRGQERPDGK
jgi:hypothetical protein